MEIRSMITTKAGKTGKSSTMYIEAKGCADDGFSICQRSLLSAKEFEMLMTPALSKKNIRRLYKGDNIWLTKEKFLNMMNHIMLDSPESKANVASIERHICACR